MNTDEMHIANEVKGRAEAVGMSLQKLSEAAAIPYTTLLRRTSGGPGFSISELIRVANIFGCTVSELLPQEQRGTSAA